MKCPECNSSKLRALDTNNRPDDYAVRRRACADCHHTWFTVEVIAPSWACSWDNPRKQGSKPCLKVPVVKLWEETT